MDGCLCCNLRKHAIAPVAPVLGLGALSRANGHDPAVAALQDLREEWEGLSLDRSPCLLAVVQFDGERVHKSALPTLQDAFSIFTP
ncbi:hypothetical protein D3C85_1801490 [compost metagenome]